MNAMQNKFAAENAQDLKGVNVDSGPTDSCPMDTRESGAGRTVAVGIRRSPSKMPDSRSESQFVTVCN